MRDSSFPYCMPYQRELSLKEKALLRHLVDREAPELAEDIDLLRVVARCGCGMCPTVLLGLSRSTTFQPSRFTLVAEYCGRAANGTLVGVNLYDCAGRLVELEAWSIDGGEIEEWPPLSSLKKLYESVWN